MLPGTYRRLCSMYNVSLHVPSFQWQCASLMLWTCTHTLTEGLNLPSCYLVCIRVLAIRSIQKNTAVWPYWAVRRFNTQISPMFYTFYKIHSILYYVNTRMYLFAHPSNYYFGIYTNKTFNTYCTAEMFTGIILKHAHVGRKLKSMQNCDTGQLTKLAEQVPCKNFNFVQCNEHMYIYVHPWLVPYHYWRFILYPVHFCTAGFCVVVQPDRSYTQSKSSCQITKLFKIMTNWIITLLFFSSFLFYSHWITTLEFIACLLSLNTHTSLQMSVLRVKVKAKFVSMGDNLSIHTQYQYNEHCRAFIMTTCLEDWRWKLVSSLATLSSKGNLQNHYHTITNMLYHHTDSPADARIGSKAACID